MTGPGTSRAADLAAQQVEQIVQAAEKAAERIKEDAGAEARQEALRELESARKEAKDRLEEAKKESDQIREQTMRAVEGRVAAAEKAAAEVLEEAQTLRDGIHRLGLTLSDQAERILRDVQAAHKRMQADLRVASSEIETPRRERITGSRRSRAPAADLSESERIIAAAEAAREGGSAPSRSRRANPLDDLDVPTWVGRER